MTSSPIPPFGSALASLALAALATSALAQSRPPTAPVRDVVDTYFGVSVHDPYRYIEDLKNPEVAAWVKAQADYTRKTLDRIPGRAALLKQIADLGDAAPARVSGVQFNNGAYYYLKRLSSQNIPRLYVRVGLNGKERMLAALDFDVRLAASESHLCCGSAGTYSLLQPELAGALRERKLAQLQASGPELILSANIGCITHLQAGTATPVWHWIEWLDKRLRR